MYVNNMTLASCCTQLQIKYRMRLVSSLQMIPYEHMWGKLESTAGGGGCALVPPSSTNARGCSEQCHWTDTGRPLERWITCLYSVCLSVYLNIRPCLTDTSTGGCLQFKRFISVSLVAYKRDQLGKHVPQLMVRSNTKKRESTMMAWIMFVCIHDYEVR